MRDYQPADIRNFAIVGHATAGKTLLCEAMLACAGVVNRMGTIAGGSTVSDYHDEEHQRQISIHSSLANLEWQEKKFNILRRGILIFSDYGTNNYGVGAQS